MAVRKRIAESANKGTRPLYNKTDYERAVQTDPDNEPYRSAFRRDFGRLIHSPAFRRLQGKTQLFPSHESDFYRNRLTHSLEVAQVAKSIAVRLNNTDSYFKVHPIDLDLVELAGLAHDIGHPPFGHNGEEALDRLLADFGGFEGNAQTLRIVSRLEKKHTVDFPKDPTLPGIVRSGRDLRLGLNLCARSLAALLKYDRPIPRTLETRKKKFKSEGVCKGYYDSEAELVDWIKKCVVGDGYKGSFKSLECSIMDIADDIAYSTYDLEDSFKAGFLSPLALTSADKDLKISIAEVVERKVKEEYSEAPAEQKRFSVEDLDEVLLTVFGEALFDLPEETMAALELADDPGARNAMITDQAYRASRVLCEIGYFRTDFTSSLVGTFIDGIEVHLNEKFPQLSKIRMNLETFKMVETLKRFSYESIVMSPRIKLSEKRGRVIINTIFEQLNSKKEDGFLLMPEDWRRVYLAKEDDKEWAARTVCDYIAGMTDRYCIEFYNRLVGSEVPSIHKGH